MSKQGTQRIWMTLALVVTVSIIVWKISDAWSVATERLRASHFALLCLFEAMRQRELHHPALVTHLLRAANQALGASFRGPLTYDVSSLERIAIAQAGAIASPSAVIAEQASWMIAIFLVLMVYIVKEKKLTRLIREQELLRDKLLAISGGWMLATVKPGSVKEVMTHILEQVTIYTDLSSAEVLQQVQGEDGVSLRSYCRSGPLISDSIREIPNALLHVEAGAINEVMRTRRVWYSGVYAEVGTILPGIRIPNTAVYPLIDRDRARGVLVLRGHGGQWNAQLSDLLAIIAREIAVLLTYGAMEEDAANVARYREMDRLRSDLLANVSHELRTPLGLIQGYAETLVYRGKRLSEDQHAEFAQFIVDESVQLENQIDKLLKVSTWKATGAHLQKRPFLGAEWIKRIQKRLSTQTRVALHLCDEHGEFLLGDPDELMDATFNLLDNALKYSADHIDLFIEMRPDTLRVRVRDCGKGVQGKDLERIFERFYRGDEHARSEIRGSGLGLSIVKEIIEAHNGRVFAQNTKSGFEVGFEIPLKELNLCASD